MSTITFRPGPGIREALETYARESGTDNVSWAINHLIASALGLPTSAPSPRASGRGK